MLGKVKHVLLPWRLFVAVLLVGLLVMPFSAPRPVVAQSPLDVVASGLNNPRHLSFGPDGALYVAEAGTGGDNCFSLSDPRPGEGESIICVGPTGSITRIQGGQQSRSITGLPSLADPTGMGASGPIDISMLGRGNAQVIIGLGASAELRDMLAKNFNAPLLSKLGHLAQASASGNVVNLVDVSAYESAANPDGGQIDTNPYGVLALPGKTIVADAGGNDLLQIDANGKISTLAVFPNRDMPLPQPPPPIPGLEDPFPMQAVPTSVVIGPDGAYYVSQLTGFPFPTGEAKVYRVPAGGGKPEVYADGLTAMVDLTFGPDGSLYVVEIAKNGLLQAEMGGDPTGAVIRVAPDGSKYEVASEGLVFPGGVAFGPDGALYVTNFSIFPGLGEVVRISDVMGTPLSASSITNRSAGYQATSQVNRSWSLDGLQSPDLHQFDRLLMIQKTFIPLISR